MSGKSRCSSWTLWEIIVPSPLHKSPAQMSSCVAVQCLLAKANELLLFAKGQCVGTACITTTSASTVCFLWCQNFKDSFISVVTLHACCHSSFDSCFVVTSLAYFLAVYVILSCRCSAATEDVHFSGEHKKVVASVSDGCCVSLIKSAERVAWLRKEKMQSVSANGTKSRWWKPSPDSLQHRKGLCSSTDWCTSPTASLSCPRAASLTCQQQTRVCRTADVLKFFVKRSWPGLLKNAMLCVSELWANQHRHWKQLMFSDIVHLVCVQYRWWQALSWAGWPRRLFWMRHKWQSVHVSGGFCIIKFLLCSFLFRWFEEVALL